MPACSTKHLHFFRFHSMFSQASRFHVGEIKTDQHFFFPVETNSKIRPTTQTAGQMMKALQRSQVLKMKPSMQPMNVSSQQLKPSTHLFDPNPFSTQPGLISEDQDPNPNWPLAADQDPNPNWSLAASQESPSSPLKKQTIHI